MIAADLRKDDRKHSGTVRCPEHWSRYGEAGPTRWSRSAEAGPGKRLMKTSAEGRLHNCVSRSGWTVRQKSCPDAKQSLNCPDAKPGCRRNCCAKAADKTAGAGSMMMSCCCAKAQTSCAAMSLYPNCCAMETQCCGMQRKSFVKQMKNCATGTQCCVKTKTSFWKKTSKRMDGCRWNASRRRWSHVSHLLTVNT